MKRINLGIFTYERAGSISLLSTFGFNIYERVGNVKRLFGFIKWGKLTP